jgi:rhamnose transport system ATP-binding protein
MGLLDLRGITKDFGATRALDGVDFSLAGGQIHGLVGENGSGKSTLMRIAAGVHRASAGQILFEGQERDYHRPAQATEDGIVLVTQEGSLMPDLSAAENIFVGRPPLKRGRVDWKGMNRRAAELLAELSLEIDPRRAVGGLPPDQRQLVEIARALAYDARILLLDEPTSTLDPTETGHLLEVMRGLADRGIAIVFVSHRLPELLAACDHFTVLRDGHLIDSEERAQVDEDWLVRTMVGRELHALQLPAHEGGAARLEVEGLSDHLGRIRDIDLRVEAGEIVGLAGLVGAGRSEILETIFGRRARAAGTVRVDGEEVGGGVRGSLARGLALVSEDRAIQGIVPSRSVHDNATLTLPVERSSFLRRPGPERALSAPWLERLAVKYANAAQPITTLSGGNQQKVLLARALVREPKVLMLDEPTRGIDLGAKQKIYDEVVELAGAGMAILVASSELPELLALCHRVIVIRGGRTVAEFNRDGMGEEPILAAAAGGGANA